MGFAGALSFPVIAEMALITLAAAVPLARLLHPWLRLLYDSYLVMVCAAFAAILHLIIAAWS